jgi:hypothetical protein
MLSCMTHAELHDLCHEGMGMSLQSATDWVD